MDDSSYYWNAHFVKHATFIQTSAPIKSRNIEEEYLSWLSYISERSILFFPDETNRVSMSLLVDIIYSNFLSTQPHSLTTRSRWFVEVLYFVNKYHFSPGTPIFSNRITSKSFSVIFFLQVIPAYPHTITFTLYHHLSDVRDCLFFSLFDNYNRYRLTHVRYVIINRSCWSLSWSEVFFSCQLNDISVFRSCLISLLTCRYNKKCLRFYNKSMQLSTKVCCLLIFQYEFFFLPINSEKELLLSHFSPKSYCY